MEEQSDISMWREMMAQAEEQRNLGMIMLKPRRVGQTYANDARGKHADMIFFEEAGSFKGLDGKAYSDLVLGNFNKPYTFTEYKFPSLRRNGRWYNLSGMRMVLHEEYRARGIGSVEELEPEEQIYLKTGRTTTEEGLRRTGRTTKIVQDCIEELIRDGRTILMDHHPRGHDYAYSNFRRTMSQLHPTVEFELEFDKRDRPKIIFITNA